MIYRFLLVWDFPTKVQHHWKPLLRDVFSSILKWVDDFLIWKTALFSMTYIYCNLTSLRQPGTAKILHSLKESLLSERYENWISPSYWLEIIPCNLLLNLWFFAIIVDVTASLCWRVHRRTSSVDRWYRGSRSGYGGFREDYKQPGDLLYKLNFDTSWCFCRKCSAVWSFGTFSDDKWILDCFRENNTQQKFIFFTAVSIFTVWVYAWGNAWASERFDS